MRSYIPVYAADYPLEDKSAIVQHILTTDMLTSFKQVDRFEREFAKRHSRSNATMTNSGSSALLAAILSMGWKAGDRIITPAVTFPTSISPLLWMGITPVLVDIDDTLNIDPEKLEDAVRRYNPEGAIIPHTLGNPCHPVVWSHFDRSIEDCCDALGSYIHDQRCGTFGDISCFSFYPAHHIMAGEGGMAVSRSNILGERVRKYVNWGRDCHCRPGQDNACTKRHQSTVDGIPWDHKYEFTAPGCNLKPAWDAQGVLALRQLEREEQFRAIRKRNYAILKAALEPLEDVVRLARELPDSDPCWFGCPITLKSGNREELIARLEGKGIGTRPLFAGNMARLPYMHGRYVAAGRLEKSDEIMRCATTIGCNHTITEEEAHYIANTVREEITR